MTYYQCRHDGFRFRMITALTVVIAVTMVYIKIMKKADKARVTKEAYRNAYLYTNNDETEKRGAPEKDQSQTLGGDRLRGYGNEAGESSLPEISTLSDVSSLLGDGNVPNGSVAKRPKDKGREPVMVHSTPGKEGEASVAGGLFEGYRSGGVHRTKSLHRAKSVPGGVLGRETIQEYHGVSKYGTVPEFGGVLERGVVPGKDNVPERRTVKNGDDVLEGHAVLEGRGHGVLEGQSEQGKRTTPDNVLEMGTMTKGHDVLEGHGVLEGQSVQGKRTVPDGDNVSETGTAQGGPAAPEKDVLLGRWVTSLGDGAAGRGGENSEVGKSIAPGHQDVLENKTMTEGELLQGDDILPENERSIGTGIVPGDTVPTRILPGDTVPKSVVVGDTRSVAGLSTVVLRGRGSTYRKDSVFDNLPDSRIFSGDGQLSEEGVVLYGDIVRNGKRNLTIDLALEEQGNILKQVFATPVLASFSRFDDTPVNESASTGGQVEGVNDKYAGNQVSRNGGFSAEGQVPGNDGVIADSQVKGVNGASGDRGGKPPSDNIRVGEIIHADTSVFLGGGTKLHGSGVNKFGDGAKLQGNEANESGGGTKLHESVAYKSGADAKIHEGVYYESGGGAKLHEVGSVVFGSGANIHEGRGDVTEFVKSVPDGRIQAEGSATEPEGAAVVQRGGTNYLHGSGVAVSRLVEGTRRDEITPRKVDSSFEPGDQSRVENIPSRDNVPDRNVPGKIFQLKFSDHDRDAYRVPGQTSESGKLKELRKERKLTKQIKDPEDKIVIDNSDLPSKSITHVSTLRNLELKNMSNTEILITISAFLSHIDIRCKRIHNYTGTFGGVWFLCDDLGVNVVPPCQMYSFSVLADLALDATVAEERKCTVTSNDPNSATALGLNRSASIDRASYPHDHLARSFTSLDFDSVLDRKQTDLDVIKMDVEGLEWAAIPRMIASGQLSGVRQLIVQFHVYDIRRRHLLRKLRCLQALEKAGFRKFVSGFRGCQQFINARYFDSQCYDVGFLKI